MVILVKKIYENENIVFNNPGGLSAITVEEINNTPVQAWLVNNPYCCGGNEAWELHFQKPTSFINVLTGVWIQYGASGALIDGNVADVVTKMGGCCGTNATVTQNYASGLPAYQNPVAKTFTLTRTDDGTIAAGVDAELAYGGNDQLVPNTFQFVSKSSGVSTYTFQAYKAPNPRGTDTVTQTARVFNSNAYGTSLSGSNVYIMNAVSDGVNVSVKGTAQTFASLVTNLQADAVAGTWGTWSTSGTTVTLTTTSQDVAVLVLGQSAP